MKKAISFLFLVFLGYGAQAQVTVKPGVRAGLNLATLTGGYENNANTKADFYVGGFVGIKLASFYTLQPEISYTRQGANYDNSNIGYPAYPGYQEPEDDLSIQYLSLAVMNKFTIVDGFHGIVGPSLDFRLSDNLEDNDFYGDGLMDFDFALNGGLGYTLPMGLTFEARYKLGLVDIFGDIYEDDYYYEDDNYDFVLNSVFQLGVTYTFK